MNIWFTADCHFGHSNIITYCNRPFDGVDKMNSALIRNWNERVKPEDTVFHVGDFCFKNTPGGKYGEGQMVTAATWEKKLNGKIIFIQGNHDKNNSCKTPIQNIVVAMGGKRIQLVHNTEHIITSNYDLYFVGHVHQAWKTKELKVQFGIAKCINVGVDVWQYKPVSLNEILRLQISKEKVGSISDNYYFNRK